MSKPKVKRQIHHRLGTTLKGARLSMRDPATGKPPRVKDFAEHLKVSRGFVYQVESGIRKPKYGDIGKWASVYGVHPDDLWKCLNRIPMNLVASLKVKRRLTPDELYSHLTETEKKELVPYINYIQWRTAHKKESVSF